MEFFRNILRPRQKENIPNTMMAQGAHGMWEIRSSGWQVGSNGALILFGKGGKSTRKWKRRDFEPILMEFLAHTTGYDLSGNFVESLPLEALSVEWYVALGFYNAGVLTKDHFMGATENSKEQTIDIPKFLLDGQLTLRIRPRISPYDTYAFDVSNHPSGRTLIRPIPDKFILVDPNDRYALASVNYTTFK